MGIIDKKYIVTMPDNSRWIIPVRLIAESRADYYKDEFGGDLQRSLDEDTLPLFESDDYEIKDWARGNMNWSDVQEQAELHQSPPVNETDYQEGWVNGESEVVDG